MVLLEKGKLGENLLGKACEGFEGIASYMALEPLH
jgi:hypothetical protein